jgi:probable F420-dependent oxidoreductase
MMGVTPGRVGVWAPESTLNPVLAKHLEDLGYGAIWIGGSPAGDLTIVDELLVATERIVVATGIVNIWKDDARVVAASHRRLAAAYPGRWLLGIGAGHPEARSDYAHPYQALVDYLDVLDAEGVPQDERVLAALGPEVLRLSAARTAGAHPYLVTPEHTRQARDLLGDGVLLAPEQKVVVDTDTARARDLGRRRVSNPYLGLANYVSNLRRLGFTDDDLADGGSDGLIDALVAHGDAGVAASRVRDHLAAGADHVAIQLLTDKGDDPMTAYRAIASALGLDPVVDAL